MLKTFKNNILVSLVLVVSISATGDEASDPQLVDDLGYFYGYSFGNMLKDGKSTDVNFERLVEGLKDSLDDQPPALTPGQSQAVFTEVRRRQAAVQAEMEHAHAAEEQAATKQAAANLAQGEAFLVENAQRKTVKVTASGLQYEVLQEAQGPTATAKSTVVVKYRGTFPDGAVFDESREAPVEFVLEQVISGWTEGLQLMSAGDKYRLFLHPDLGYGAGSVGQIPPNSVLVFDIELLEIK